MANIHEITKNLIQFRGEVKAAQITADGMTQQIKTGLNIAEVVRLVDDLEYLNTVKFSGTIWFVSGSYAYLDKDGSGYYWNFVQVPEIPAELS